DARGVGVNGELHVDIVHEKHSLVCSVEKLVENKYRVTFMPRQNGKYRVYVYFNGYDVKGSPYIMRVGTKGRSGKTRSSPHHDSKSRAESPSMLYTSSSTKHNDFRTAKKELYAQDAARSYSPQYSPSPEDGYKSKDYYTKREEVYSSHFNSPKREETPPNKYATETYTKSSSRKNNDYYYNKENELFQTKKETDVTLKSPRKDKPATNSFVSKNLSSEKYLSRQRNDSFSPIDMRASPRLSPITVTTTSRYESSTRNIAGSPRHFSSSPSPKRDTHSPSGNYVTSSTHRISSPVTVSTQHRLSSPVTAPRISSPALNSSKGETYKISEKSSTYKTSNFVSSEKSPSYLTSRRESSP
ncbi:Filamin-A, partial [Pseudolycoriella hygida]